MPLSPHQVFRQYLQAYQLWNKTMPWLLPLLLTPQKLMALILKQHLSLYPTVRSIFGSSGLVSKKNVTRSCLLSCISMSIPSLKCYVFGSEKATSEGIWRKQWSELCYSLWFWYRKPRCVENLLSYNGTDVPYSSIARSVTILNSLASDRFFLGNWFFRNLSRYKYNVQLFCL